MQRMARFSLAICLGTVWSVFVSASIRGDEVLIPRTYPVADLVTPLTAAIHVVPDSVEQAPPATDFQFEPLIAHIKKVTGPRPWKEGQGEIKAIPQTLSIVIRQTQDMHERIMDELCRLRREQDLQIVTEFIVATGPRKEISAIAAEFSGELGRFEQEQFRETLRKSKTLQTSLHSKITTFNCQTAVLNTHGNSLVADGIVTDDRCSVRLIDSYTPENQLMESLAVCRSFQVHDGRAAVVRFEAPLTYGFIPPADETEECLVFVSPQIIVRAEEEDLLDAPTIQTP